MIVTILMSLPTNIMANALFLNDIIPVRDGINWIKDIENIYKLSGFLFQVIWFIAWLFIIRNFLIWTRVEVGDALLYGLKKWWIYIAASILYGLALLGGFILLIIPWIIFALWFTFYSYAIAFEEKSITESLSYSKSLVVWRWWGVFWKVVWFWFVTWFLLSLPVGIIWYGTWYFLSNDNIVVEVLLDTILYILWIPALYVTVWLFLGIQKFPKVEEQPAVV